MYRTGCMYVCVDIVHAHALAYMAYSGTCESFQNLSRASRVDVLGVMLIVKLYSWLITRADSHNLLVLRPLIVTVTPGSWPPNPSPTRSAASSSSSPSAGVLRAQASLEASRQTQPA